MNTILNLTPHAVRVFSPEGELLAELPASGQVARVSSAMVPTGTVAGLPVFRQTTGAVTGLPLPKEGVSLIVSAMVRMALPTRGDLFSPGDLRRDAAGQPVGCVGLVGNGGAM